MSGGAKSSTTHEQPLLSSDDAALPPGARVDGLRCCSSRSLMVLLMSWGNATLYLNRANISIAATYMYAHNEKEKSIVLSSFYW